MAAKAGLDQFSLEQLEFGISGFLGALHERGIADHVGRQDGCRSPLDPLLSHGASERFEWAYTSMTLGTRERNEGLPQPAYAGPAHSGDKRASTGGSPAWVKVRPDGSKLRRPQ